MHSGQFRAHEFPADSCRSIAVLGDLRRSHRQPNDFPGSLGPFASQTGSTLRTGLQDLVQPGGWESCAGMREVDVAGASWSLSPKPFLPGGPLTRFGRVRRAFPLVNGRKDYGSCFQALNPHRLPLGQNGRSEGGEMIANRAALGVRHFR